MTRKNLTTDGTEFNLPDGSSYSGPYHIHVNRGAMKGGIHVNSAHPQLTPKTLLSLTGSLPCKMNFVQK